MASDATRDPEQLELIPRPPKLSTCRSCRRSIIWTRTERGKKMPLDADPIPTNALLKGGHQQTLFVLRDRENSDGPLSVAAWGLEGTEDHYVSHFATCPNADEHRRPRSGQKSELPGETFEDMFDDPGRNDIGKAQGPDSVAQPTQREAAILAYPGSGTQRLRVLDLLVARRLHGATDAEMQMALSMNPSTQRPRRVELVEGGWVEPTSRRRETGSGRNAVVWIATAKAFVYASTAGAS